MANVALIGLEKAFGTQTALKGIDLAIADGEFLVIVGPSGCGKSTLLRVIAGLEAPTEGDVLIEGQGALSLTPAQRGVAMVFQSYALYPHLNVRDNMAFGLRMAKRPESEIAAAVGQAATLLGIEDLLDRRPKELSGGQRQRVAIGRAIVRQPRLFLLDEPLSNLDAGLRIHMRHEFARLHRELKTTMIYVTHDQEEALTMSDRIAVFDQGEIAQIGTPADVYERPVNPYVAKFVGLSNLLTRDGRTLMVRPEKLRLYDMSPESQSMETLAGQVVDVVYVGLMTRYIIRTQEGDDITALELNARASQSQPRFTRGQPVWVGYSPDSVHVL